MGRSYVSRTLSVSAGPGGYMLKTLMKSEPENGS